MKRQRSGNTVLEFTLVGIPLLFILIGTFEMARGMWLYHTLANAAKAGARFAIVHGNDCTLVGNTCTKTVADVARAIQRAGIGLPASDVTVTLSGSAATTVGPATLATLFTRTSTYWPVGGPDTRTPGAEPGEDLTVTVRYPFRSAITFFWPGAASQPTWGQFTLRASAREMIQF